ncbi:hypothetical protein QR680_013598 [Steinernema hermaphroditum]|uniref:Peptidase S1 domain-containing protein n=1 Tax=Steinernema hermaphroditum TaxID=289476 RepID=A0AA39M2M6_9BILA|nr:hypothetical protein QR680_013598 [Steinernema hermaphroditum]
MKLFLVFLLFLVSAVECLPLNDKGPSELIFGGSKASRGQWPWHVFLDIATTDGFTFCGGTLITKRHVLTAAHCLQIMRSGSVAILGIVDSYTPHNTTGAQTIGIESLHIHPNFTFGGSFHDDIGIITLKSEANITEYVKTIKIKSKDDDLLSSTEAYVTGYGAYKIVDHNLDYSRYLRVATVPTIDFQWCKERWANMTSSRVSLWKKQICAGATGRGIGPGDSGGPLQVHSDGWYQIGVSAFVVENEQKMTDQATYPGVFTRASKYCDFIAEKTGDEFQCL